MNIADNRDFVKHQRRRGVQSDRNAHLEADGGDADTKPDLGRQLPRQLRPSRLQLTPRPDVRDSAVHKDDDPVGLFKRRTL